MKSYTTVEYYTDNYLMGRKAVISTADFPFYAMKATQEIKKYTFNSIQEDNISDDVQLCCCEIAEYLHEQEQEDTGNVQSEKKGEWSVTYVSAEVTEDIKQSKIKEIIYNWLANTGLLYRGC